MKKLFKILGIILMLCITTLLVAPFFLESKFDAIVQRYADDNLNATLSFDAISLSLIHSFPKANVRIVNLKIVNQPPFENETLASAKLLTLEIPMLDIFKGTSHPLVINEIIANELLLTLKSNKNGTVNYDILKPSSDNETSNLGDKDGKQRSSFTFDVKHLEIKNSAFTYIDQTSGMEAYLTEFYHNSSGFFSANVSSLNTTTTTWLSFKKDNANYLENTLIKLDALFEMDLQEQVFTFKNNKGYINKLPLEFNGFVQQKKEGQLVDITFKNPDASFKDFIAMLPKPYAKDLDAVVANGNFTINGVVKGLMSDISIPSFDINLVSHNASVQYPNLPKGIRNIFIDTSVKNTTGNTDDTFVDINRLDFKIDNDTFTSEAHIKHLSTNPKVNAKANGIINLANLTQAYPIEITQQLKGILKANLSTSFDLQAIETNAYDRIENFGSFSVSDFVFSSEDMPHPIQINASKINLKPKLITLEHFDAQTGNTDFKATGTINNLTAFLLGKKELQGAFDVNANHVELSDFMTDVATEVDNTKTENDNKPLSAIKIPKFLDCSIDANAKEVVYDNLTLKNVKGNLRIKDETAALSNLTTDIFEGQMTLNGNVSTKATQPTFDMAMGIQKFDIASSFSNLEMLSFFAPIADVIDGKLSSNINLSGLLDSNFTLDLNSITGDALAEFFSTEVKPQQSPLLNQFSNALKFVDVKQFNIDDVKASLAFSDGQVVVKPFTITHNDISMEVSGSHSLTNAMNYDVAFDLPAKYLGSNVNRLIGKINDDSVNDLNIPVTASITGTFAKPSVSTDLTSGVSQLTKQLIDIEKQKLINKGKKEVNSLLGNLLQEKDTSKTDSTTTKKSSNPLKNALGNFLKGNKTKKKKGN